MPVETVKVMESRYESLLKASEALAQHCELAPLLEALPGCLRGIVSFDSLYVILHAPETHQLRLHMLEGASPASSVGLPEDASVAGWSLGRRRPVIGHTGDPAIREAVPALGAACICTLPLDTPHRSLGALAFVSRGADAYDETQLPFLELVTAQVALGIDNVVEWQGSRARDELQAQVASRLRRHEEQWRAVFENSAVGVALADPDGRFRAANRAFERMLGYTEAELLQLTVLDVTHEDHRAATMNRVRELLNGEREQFQMEKQVRRRDGSTIWVRNTVSLVPSAGATPRALMAVSEDITAQTRANEALRLSEARWRTLLEINNAIITHLTQDALLHSVAETLGRVIPFDRAAFTLYNPQRETFRYLAMEGAPDSEYFRPGQEFHRSLSVSAEVFDRRRGRLRRDLETEQQYANDRRLVAEGIRSDCVVPLIVAGRSIGTLNIGSRTPGRYTEDDLALLQEIGNQVALAVENMQSYEAIAALQARLEKENVYLQEEIRTEHNFGEIVGNSPALLAVLHNLEQVARTDSTVLICGETGTGKELIARAIHGRSQRRTRPLVKVNCSAISAGLVESELFGHLKGAFTGAIERRIGRFELADGGTIFLDEVGELPPETQVKLLRVLQEQEFEPVGSSRTMRVDVRVIAATNRHLPDAVRAGQFRADLFYRLNVFPLDLPALRDRRPDIPQLATFFLDYCAKKLGKSMTGISRDAMDALVAYGWPGNVRELQNVIERAIILARGPVMELEPDLRSMLITSELRVPAAAAAAQATAPAASAFPTLQDVERQHIVEALRQSHGVVEGVNGAAKLLNLHPNTLRHRMGKLGIKRTASHQS